LLFGIELVEDKETKEPAGPERVAAAISGCRERGLVIANNADTVAGLNNVLTLAPPLIIGEDEVEFIARTLRESIHSV
jgi:4-aminobutyrate aminotransferase-like enzyme